MARLTLTVDVRFPWWLMPLLRIGAAMEASGLLPGGIDADKLAAFVLRHTRLRVRG